MEIGENELKEKEGLIKNLPGIIIFDDPFRLELKQKAEIPENEAKEKHQKLWEGNLD